MRTRIALLTVAAAGLASVACGPDDPAGPSTAGVGGEMPLESPPMSETVPVDLAEPVATVDLGHGGVATFLDLGDGHIGIAERAPARARFISLAMIRSRQATALEVYLALRPRNAAVPAALLRDHRRIARSRNATASPRLLAPPSGGASGLEDPGHGPYICDTGDEWIDDWKAAFAGITKYREAAYFTANLSSKTFYPGAPVYNGTNTNSVTYLGACNGDEWVEIRLEVHRRINGNWVQIQQTPIPPGEKYTFYSGIPASYRGRVNAPGGDPFNHFGIGAAWTLSPPVASP